MKVTNEELADLANIIVEKLRQEFSLKKLSGNLLKTIQVLNEGDKIQVIIPARTYNMLQYQKNKVIIHTSHGSYASKLDETGSEFFIYPGNSRKGSFKIHPGNHVGYVNNVVNQAVSEWLGKKSQKYKMIRMKG